jgi:hypothetical protein
MILPVTVPFVTERIVPSVPSGIAVDRSISITSPAIIAGVAGSVIVVVPPAVATLVALIFLGKLQQQFIFYLL